jgi:hypothetical protein
MIGNDSLVDAAMLADAAVDVRQCVRPQ